MVKIQIDADSVDAEIIRVIGTGAPICSAENGFAFSWLVESRRKTEPAAEAPILLAPLGTPCSDQPNQASHSF